MSYIIRHYGRYLSYFYGNGNGKVSDIIGFSFKHFSTFETKEEAFNHISYMKDTIRKRTDFDMKLHLKLFKIFDTLRVEEYNR